MQRTLPDSLPSAWRRLAGALLLGALLVAGGGPVLAQDILIVRPAEHAETTVNEARYLFTVEVSAFSPLTALRVNGQAVDVPTATWTVVQVPLQLEPGENVVVVDATTEFGTARKEFVINLKFGEPAAEARKALQVIAMVGAQSASNPARLPQDEVAGVRTFVLVVPRYDIVLGERSFLRLGGIFSRDAYNKAELATQEVAFTQVNGSWLRGDVESGQLTLGAAYNTIDLEYDNLLRGKTHVEEDALLFGSWRRQFGQEKAWEAGLEVKRRDIQEDVSNPEFDEDALVYSLRGQLEAGLGAGVRGKGRLAWEETDADGRFSDKTTQRLNLEASWPLGSFIPSLGVRVKRETYAETDPTLGEQPQSTLTTATLTANYQFLPGWLVTAEALAESQSSNVDELAYDNTAYTLALVYVY